MNKSKFTVQKIAYIAVLAAIVRVVTFFRFPLLGSVPGGLAAMIVAPILYSALSAALQRAHLLDKMRK